MLNYFFINLTYFPGESLAHHTFVIHYSSKLFIADDARPQCYDVTAKRFSAIWIMTCGFLSGNSQIFNADSFVYVI